MKIFKPIIFLIALAAINNTSCREDVDEFTKETTISEITRKFIDRNNNSYLFIVAHRGNGFDAPENSLSAIDSCIKYDIDIIELDIKKTMDDVLIVFHDDTLGRTVDNVKKDSIQFLLWEEIKNLNLKIDNRYYTGQKIPTLREALLRINNNCMVNLDYAFPHLKQVINIAIETNTINNIIIKGTYSPELVTNMLGNKQNSILYMPIIKDMINDTSQNYYFIPEYLNELNPYAFELVFDSIPSILTNLRVLGRLKENNAKLWINMLVPELNGGLNEKYNGAIFTQNYQWIWDKGFRIIQTDFPKELKRFRDSLFVNTD